MMQPAGLFVMIASVGTVTVLFGWCIWKVLVGPAAGADHLSGVDGEAADGPRP